MKESLIKKKNKLNIKFKKVCLGCLQYKYIMYIYIYIIY